MKSGRRLCVVVALIGVVLFGQTKPKDVDGWSDIKWGMTIGDARAAYNVETPPSTNEYWTTLELKPVNIGDIAMHVYVGAKHGTDRISKVNLWMYFGLRDSAPSAGPRDFDTLKTLLIQKYGSPANEETKREYGDAVRTVLWTFPSTSVLLKLSQKESSRSLGSVDLTYTATDKKALDVL